MLWILTNSLITHTLYTHIFSLIFAMWDYVCVLNLQVTWQRMERSITQLKSNR